MAYKQSIYTQPDRKRSLVRFLLVLTIREVNDRLWGTPLTVTKAAGVVI